MRRTIDNVADDIREWPSKFGGFRYSVTAFTTTREVISATKTERERARELQELLIQAIGQEQEFILEDNGKSQNAGVQKWKLIAFGPPEGVWTYSTIKGGQPEVGAGGARPSVESDTLPESHTRPAPTNNVDASIRASVALKAAAQVVQQVEDCSDVLALAELFDEWLAKKSSGFLSPLDQGVSAEGEAVGTPDTLTPEQVESAVKAGFTGAAKWSERAADWGKK